MTIRRHIRFLSTLLCVAACAHLAACSRDTPTELRVPAVDVLFPEDGADFTWSADADPSMDGFQIDIQGMLTGFDSLDGAALSLAIDGTASPALATLRGEHFSFERVTLTGGTRRLTIAARAARQSAVAEIAVTIPGGNPTDVPTVEISTPENGKVFSWSEDGDGVEPKFQIDVTGTLHNMPVGDSPPTVVVQIDGSLTEAIVQVSAIDESGESEFSARNLTLESGVHAIFVEAVQGDTRAFSQIHIAIPPAPGGEDPAYALSIEAPANGTTLDWGDDVLADMEGFQIDVRGTLQGFGSNAALALSQNGTALDVTPIRESAGSYEFADVSLPSGQQVIVVTATETVEGTLLKREALAIVTVPTAAQPEGLTVAITSPLNGKSFAWSEDSDPLAEKFQIDVRGKFQAREGEPAATLTLQIDGVDVEAEAIIQGEVTGEDESQGTGAPELLPEREFAFEDVTLDGGVHQIAVIAAQGSQRVLDQISIAIPAPLPDAPSADIASPLDGAALRLEGGRVAIDVSGTYVNAQRLVLHVDGQPRATLEPEPSQSGQFTFLGVELEAGAHALQVQVSDGTYQGVSSVVTVHVAEFDLVVHWPSETATLYADDSGDLTLDLIGEIKGCDGCQSAPSVTVQVNAGTPEEVPVDGDRAFRHALHLSPAVGGVTLLVRARQALQDTEATGTSPTFEAEVRRELSILDAALKPAFGITFTRPADGSVLTWRDNTDLSGDKFQIDVEAAIEGLSLGEASFKLYVDGVLQKTDVSQDCALTTMGQAITALTCRHVELSAGAHLISLTATSKANGATVEAHTFVTAPDISDSPQAAALIISTPADGAVLDWESDLSMVGGFQTDVGGRFTGFGDDVEFSLLIDGATIAATAVIGAGTYAFRGVTLDGGERSLKVLAKEMNGGDLMAASDEITVTVPPAQVIDIDAVRDAGGVMSQVTGTLANFSEAAVFTLDVYVDGALTRQITPEASEIAQGVVAIEVTDAELGITPDGACHYLTFTLIGVEGQSETSATDTLEIGECGSQKPRAIVITSPRHGSTLRVANADSLWLSVTGVLLGYDADALVPQLVLGESGSCSTNRSDMTFLCEGDFEVGTHTLVVKDAVNGVESAGVSVTIYNSSGCPVTLSLDNAPVGEDGVLEFNRQTPGIRLVHQQGVTAANYTFFGSVPTECAGGTITVLKKLSGGGYAAEARTTNILADGTFAYRATLNDAETDAELAFSASRQHFAAAAGAQLTYTADFTAPTLVQGAGDTFTLGSTAVNAVLHENDLRQGLKAAVTAAEAGGVRGAFDITFTAQGLSRDASAADTLTIAYNGSDTPILSEEILQTSTEGSIEIFTKAVSLPEGDWTLSITLSDAMGNTSTASYPIHVDLGCGVTLTSPLPNSAIAIDPGTSESPASIDLIGTSSCAQTAYGLRVGEAGTAQTCQASGDDGSFECAVAIAPSSDATEITLIAPNGGEQNVRVFQISSDHTISVEAPRLANGGFVVVSTQNRHCDLERGCDDGYVVNLSPEDETSGTFALRIAVAMDAQYAQYDELSCRYLIGGQALEAATCSIDDTGVIDDRLSLPLGTRDDFLVEIEGNHSESGATFSASIAMGVTIASKKPDAPLFQLPADGAVTDCVAGGAVTCVQDRHQGILDVWLDVPAAGVTRKRGFATGTTISIANASNNTEAFDAATFEDGSLMSWFSAVAQADAPLEMQRLQVTPMNLIHLGAQDEDVHGNYSDVSVVRSIDMFWNVFKRTFTEENAASAILDASTADVQFGARVAAGDLNGDGVDDLAISGIGGTGSVYLGANAFVAVYYGTRGLGITANKKQFPEPPGVSNFFGSSLSILDIDHDGYDDLLATNNYNAQVLIYWGGANGLHETPARINSQYCMGGFCYGVMNIEKIADLDRDGYPDIAFSEATDYVDNYTTDNVFVILTSPEIRTKIEAGQDTLTDLSTYLITSATTEGLGYVQYDLSGHNIATVATPSDDSGEALLIGAPYGQKVYFFNGATLASDCLTAAGGCDAGEKATAIIARPAGSENQKFGRAIAILDQNNDGIDDLFLGMPSQTAGEQGERDNYVMFALGAQGSSGFSFGTLARFNTETIDRGFFGESLLPANLLGDGHEALIVGGYSDVNDRVHIFWNTTSSALNRQYGSIIEGPATFGYSLETGDFNGDGLLDLFIGAPSRSGFSGNGDKNGEFYVYY